MHLLPIMLSLTVYCPAREKSNFFLNIPRIPKIDFRVLILGIDFQGPLEKALRFLLQGF